MAEPAPFVEDRVKVLFRARCRLLSRYDSAYRVIEKYGVGEIIVLQNVKRKLYRIIIIREQTLEVCTNHIVHADTVTQLHLGDPTACWYAIMDYTVIEQPRPGYIAIRFKTAALCAKYMAQIEDAKVQGNPGPYSPVNNEQVLFKAICKISCYDSTDQAAKTNAIGEIKIIREDSRKLYRVVMNRDLCLTVCTDHVIDDDTEPQVHCGNRNVCSYFIMDYTESMHAEPRYVVINFMTADLCATYMGHIGEAKAYPRFAC